MGHANRIVIFICLLSPLAALGQSYSMIDLGLLPGDNSGQAVSINDNGQIAGDSGQAQDGDDLLNRQAIEWNAGSPLSPQVLADPLSPTPANVFSIALDNTNEVIGYTYAPNNAVVFDPTNSLKNHVLATNVMPLAVNNQGAIVGEDSTNYAAILDSTGGNNQIDLGTISGRTGSAATAINDSEEIVGVAGNPGIGIGYPFNTPNLVSITVELWGPHAALFDNTGAGHDIDLGTLGGLYSGATGVSDTGQIVGYAYNVSGYEHATLFDSIGNGNNMDLGTLGGNTSIVTAISHNGIAVGMADDQYGFSQPAIFDVTGKQNNINLALQMPAAQGFVQDILGVNNSGMIVGTAYTHNGSSQPVLLNPNPTPGPVPMTFSYTATAQANTNSVSTTNAPAGVSFSEQWQEKHTGQILNDNLNETIDIIAYNHNGSSLDIISQMIESEGAYNDFRAGNTETTVQAVIQIGTAESVPAGTPLEAELSSLLESDLLSSYAVSVMRDGATIADLSSSNQSTYFTVYAGEQLELQNNFITNTEAPGYGNFLGVTFTIVPEPAVAGLLFPFLLWLPRRRRR